MNVLPAWGARRAGPLPLLGWLLVLVAAGVALAAVARGLGFRWDPLNVTERRAERAESRAAVAEDNATARTLEADGRADQLQRVETIHRQIIEVQTATARAEAEARSTPADTHLNPVRTDRLRRHDRELCRLAPTLTGCAAAPGAAGDGDAALGPGPPA